MQAKWDGMFGVKDGIVAEEVMVNKPGRKVRVKRLAAKKAMVKMAIEKTKKSPTKKEPAAPRSSAKKVNTRTATKKA